MPRIFMFVAALALVVPASAQAARTVSVTTNGPQQTVTYNGDEDPDNVAVTWDYDRSEGDDFRYVFAVNPPPTGCSGGGPVVCFIGGDEGPSPLVLIGNGGDDAFDVAGFDTETFLYGTGGVRAEGGAGGDEFLGSRYADHFIGGTGNDTQDGIATNDRYDGGDGFDTLDLSASSAAHTVTLDGAGNDWPGTSNVMPDVEHLVGGAGIDTFTGAAGAQTLDGGGANDKLSGGDGDDALTGGEGNDELDGGPGADALNGGPGDDTIRAQDRVVDEIECGQGQDVVFADWNDTIIDEVRCQEVHRSVRDDDNDGSPHGADCDDGNPNIRPGAGEIPDNGIDEDCRDGDLKTDRDGDGSLPPFDCNDADPAIRPGVRDQPQNGIDEDCSGADADWIANSARIANNWAAFRKYTRVKELVARDVPAAGRVQITCKGKRKKGCRFKTKRLKVRNGRASATALFKKAKLRKGVVIELRITAPDTIGKVLRYTIRRRKLPKTTELCLPPGASSPTRC